MNPLQGSNQVGVANIGGIPIFFYAVWGKVQIAQNIQTVIYTYDNNIAKFGKILTIQTRTGFFAWGSSDCVHTFRY